MENRERQVVRAVVFSSGEVTDIGVLANRTAFRLNEHLEDILNGLDFRRKVRRRTARNVVEFLHVLRERSTEFVDSWNQCFEVIAVLNAGNLCDFLNGLTIKADEIAPQDGVVIVRG